MICTLDKCVICGKNNVNDNINRNSISIAIVCPTGALPKQTIQHHDTAQIDITSASATLSNAVAGAPHHVLGNHDYVH